MEQLVNAISENFSALLSGFFVIAGALLGWFLNILTIRHQNRPQLIFLAVGTPDDELTSPELRTSTSSSDYSIRIVNTGRTACFLENIEIFRKGYMLVDCQDVCGNHGAILPNESVLYTLMEQEADSLAYNYSKYYKKPSRIYVQVCKAMQHIPILRSHIGNPELKQGECKVISYTIGGKRLYGKIDFPMLYIRKMAAARTTPEA